MINPCCVLSSTSLVQTPISTPNLSALYLLAKVPNSKIWAIVGMHWSVVPYLVLVKIGKSTERTHLGNRGKRDSQMLLMHFLNKVYFNYFQFSFLNLQIYFTGSHQFANESIGAWNVSSDQECHWSQSFLLWVLVHGGRCYNHQSFVGKPFDLSVCLFFLAFTIYLFI